MTATLRTLTLGCKVNQYETQYVREGLERAGYVPAEDGQAADLCIVNTCTVTNEGDAKSRQAIRRLSRENPASRIVVMGCYATRAPEEVGELPGVAEVVTDKRELPDLLGRFGVIDIPDGISQFGDRHRAYVKVQDGCMLRCTYCIIPHVRPDLTSRPTQQILDEARRLVDNGYREIVLTGIHLGHYGVDWNWNKPKSEWVRLAHLVEQIALLPGDFRIRLSSIEATEVTRELIEVLKAHGDKICPHLHICLQSGSDRILARMNRRWSSKMFLSRCDLVRDQLDSPALTTDVIVGFPGETEEDFQASCEVSRRAGFSKIHIFPFSARRGTKAADFENQLPKSVKSDRCRQLSVIEAELRDSYFQSLVGRDLTVLGERVTADGKMVGKSCRYATVETSGNEHQVGELQTVRANSVDDGLIVGITEPMRSHTKARRHEGKTSV